MSSVPLGQLGPTRSTARTPLESIRQPVRALYVHVPFCFHKCHYCDFYSFVDTQDRQPAFTDRLSAEWGPLARHAFGSVAPSTGKPTLTTVFVGGGTPTLLRPDLWERLLERFHELFRLDQAAEFTIECNPETASPELFRILRAGGVNRISIGAQSFHEAHLKTLERWHEPANVARALRLAADAGIERRSLDLIFAVPGQSLEDWRRDLEQALDLGGDSAPIEHISCYGLTYEPNTAMTKRLERGDFEPAPESLEADMYELTLAVLRDRGFARYEVSNFATPGAECRHNLAYWRQEQWLASGPSGSAHAAGHRWKNVPRLSEWMEGVERSGGFSPIVDHEPPDPARALRERIMTGLRLAEGLDATALVRDAQSLGDPSAAETLHRETRRAAEQGLLIVTTDRWTLTDRGFLLADGVASRLMHALDQHA